MVEGSGSTRERGRPPLDDVMLAMDVVDTLRHREQLILRELGSDDRERKLIDRLRQIYGSQGIEVPDRVLADGVRALEERRFVYTPPAESLSVKLARLYVRRAQWGRRLAIVGGVLLALSAAWHFGWQRPRAARRAAYEERISVALPRALEETQRSVLELATAAEARRQAENTFQSGRAALADGDDRAAEDALDGLRRLESVLRSEYAVRIAADTSGVWRVPSANPDARNWYLIVEAVGRDGQPVPVRITSEEDNRTAHVKRWGLRVSEAVFDGMRADKLDDGILQNRRVGQKRRGELEHEYTIETTGGCILDW